MKRICCYALSLVLALSAGGCKNAEFTRVAPGQSAKMEYLTRHAPLGTPKARITFRPHGGGWGSRWSAAANHYGNIQPLPDFVLEPSLPEPPGTANKVSELYTEGSLAMNAGKTGEAIMAFEQVVQIDPNFTDAWNKLATLYHKAGNEEKAKEAQKHSKKAGPRESNDPRGPASLLQ